MTGIERLRELARQRDTFVVPSVHGTYGSGYVAATKDMSEQLRAIADQIEREQGGRVSRMRVLSVVTEMERHCLGHEGMEDSPVARWARELREALGGEERDLTDEGREAVAWVREHGGLDAVRRRWECLSYYADPVPRSCMEKRLARRQRQIDESHAALRRRREIISELNRRACDLTRENAELRKRAMPEGMCWPVFEDGEPVRIGDVVSDVEVRSVVFRDGGILLSDCTSVPGWGTWRSYKEPIKRPAPKVLDAEGNRIESAMDVWWICEGDERGVHAEKLHVESIGEDGLVECSPYNGGTLVSLEPSELYVNKPVPASDGRPLREGETVWDTNGDELVIGALEDGGQTVTCRYADVGDAIPVHGMWSPSDLTHTKPEPPDTWERIEEDADALVDAEINGEGSCNAANSYCNRRGLGEGTSFVLMARDLVRRARALAERERGE